MGKRIVSISGELFTEMITEGWQAGGTGESLRCIEGLPKGARFVASSVEPLRRLAEPWQFTAHLMYEHPDWPDTPVGEPLENQRVTFRWIRAE